MSRQHFEHRLLAGILALLWLIPTVSIAEGNKLDKLSIRAESFDYSALHDWGFYHWIFPVLPGESSDPERYNKIGYLGMTAEQQLDLIRHPDHWRQGWVRLRIEPGVEWGLGPNDSTDEWLNPLLYGDMLIQHVYISNAQDIGIYPKPYMVFAGNPAAFFDEPAHEDGDLWYIEVLIEERDRTSAEITQALQQAEVLCDVFLNDDDSKEWSLEKEHVAVSLSDVERFVCFEENTIQISATQMQKSDKELYGIFYQYSEYSNLLSEAELTPEHFQCYELELTMTNSGPYPVVWVLYTPMQGSQDVWLLYNEDAFTIQRCKPGESIQVYGYYLIARNQYSPEELLDLPLMMEVCTEMAGFYDRNPWEGTHGSYGIPFSVPIDMSSCVIRTD